MSRLFAKPTVFASIDSTNRYLVDRARAGELEGAVAVADFQEAGRGRLGRSWIAGPGSSLLCSMLFRPTVAITHANIVSTIVALGARAAIGDLTGIEPVLKWPNDLLVDEKKVAGLLGEIVTFPSGYALVVGIGINLIWRDGVLPTGAGVDLADLFERATTLYEISGIVVDRAELLERMLLAIERDYLAIAEAGVEAKIMDRYRAACGTIGRRVRVEARDKSYIADALGVSDEGRLIVRVGAEVEELDAADVIHLRALPS